MGTTLVLLVRTAPTNVVVWPRNPQRDLPTLKVFMHQHACLISYLNIVTRLVRRWVAAIRGASARGRAGAQPPHSGLDVSVLALRAMPQDGDLQGPRGWRVVALDTPGSSTGPNAPRGRLSRYWLSHTSRRGLVDVPTACIHLRQGGTA